MMLGRLRAIHRPAGTACSMPIISAFDAAILGVVEGLTEFLPVSSTGHLILTTHLLGLDAAAGLTAEQVVGVKAFEIVIQIGAMLAVVGLYASRVKAMLLGLVGRDREGLNLLLQLFIGVLPAVVLGVLADDWIKARLFGIIPVIWALLVGGIAMIGIELWRGWKLRDVPPEERPSRGRTVAEMTLRAALIIGCAQCVAMWPGTSRSMMTIVAALLLGFSPRAAAEFSFLLALPTLGGAALHDAIGDGAAILTVAGWGGITVGLITSFVVAWLAVKGFIALLNRHGLIGFGVYRIILAGVFWWLYL